MFKEQTEKYQNEIDALLQEEYQRYKESSKRALIGSGNKHSTRVLKQNTQPNSPESITFGRLKQMNQSEYNLQNLMKLLDCRKYEEAEEKIINTNKFLGHVKQMTRKIFPQQQPTLINSWRLIKKATATYAKLQGGDQQ